MFSIFRRIIRLKNLDPVWIVFGAIIFLLMLTFSASLIRQQWLLDVLSDPFSGTSTPAQVSDAYPIEPPGTPGTDIAGNPDQTDLMAHSEDDTFHVVVEPIPTPIGGGAGRLAFVSERSGIPQIWLIDVANKEKTQLTEIADGACQPAWSPDGMRIVVTTPCSAQQERYPGSRLVIIDVESGSLTPLPASLEGDYDPAWSPDGEWIAFTTLVNGRPQLAKINLQDLALVRLSSGDYPDFSPAWSPDGSQLVFTRIRNVSQIWLMDADGDNVIQFTLSGMINNSNPVWFSDGSMILFSQALGLESPSKQLYGMRLEDLGQTEEYPIIPRGRLDFIPLMDNVDVSPDGFWLAFDYWYFDVLSDIYMMTFPGSNLTQLTYHPAMDYNPVWSPRP